MGQRLSGSAEPHRLHERPSHGVQPNARATQRVSKWAARYPELGLHGHGAGLQPQTGRPYGVFVELWVSPLGVPCNQLPLGTISAVDSSPARCCGKSPQVRPKHTGPLGIATHLPMPVGMPTYAGTSVTAGGLVFFAGTQDFYLRAYDAHTGKELWKYRLPVGSSATPMSYSPDRPSVRGGLGGRGCPVAQDRRLPHGFRAPRAQAVSREHQELRGAQH